MLTDLPFAIQPDAFYRDLGLRAGLEVHQQLLTRKKLFCNCPSGPYSSDWDAEILRHMRPTLSELGEYDGTALMEFKTRKEIVYQITRETTCTYEMDDAPPFRLNEEALDIALEIALLLDCNIVGEIHIARKQYLDGSIPTGFQRTTLLGVDGEVPYGSRTIGIVQLGLEEDSCRQIDDRGHRRIFRTDRLSRPLIETVTRPQMKTPYEVAEVGEILRRLHRATGRVRTGIGAGRQDVNVSIDGGTRIEIKGVHRLAQVPALVHVEALRQRQLLGLRRAIRDRGLRIDSWQSRTVDLTDSIRPTAPPNLAAALAYGGRVEAVVLPNMIHSDEPEWGGLPGAERLHVRKKVKLGDADALILVWGAPRDVQTAVGEIDLRVREAFAGVPSETRQALAAGLNAFKRILPGPERMYPDTDLPLTHIKDERLERIQARLPEHPWTREARYRAQGLPRDVVRRLVFSPRHAALHDRLVEKGRPAMLAGTLLARTLTGLRRRGVPVDSIPDEQIERLLEACSEGRVHREIFPDLLERMALADTDSLAGLPLPLTDAEQDDLVRRALEDAEGRSFPGAAARWRFLMGTMMQDARGRTGGADLARRLARADGGEA